MEHRFVIWGAGTRGRVIYRFLGDKIITAFIDTNYEKYEHKFCEKEVISFEEYKENYRDYFIIISPVNYSEIVEILKKNEINKYFILRECPSELQEFAVPWIFEQLPFVCTRGEHIVVYGLNLFSILLYDWLLKQAFTNIYLVPNRDADLLVTENIIKEYPEINIVSLEEVEDEVDRILLTVEQDKTFLEINNSKTKIENAYDFSDKLEIYYNKDIEKFKNLHTNERCFIVATGPSLKLEDLDCLYKNEELCISMNRIYCEFENIRWRPNYYVALDKKFVDQFAGDIKKLDVANKFITDGVLSFWNNCSDKNIYKFHEHCNPFSPEMPGFSDNFAQKVYNCYTVTYACLQLAAYLGFKEIYLVGVDFTSSIGSGSSETHFSKSYITKNMECNVFCPTETLLGFQSAEKYSRQHGFRIYNATRGGKLEVFERVDFDSLF